MRNLEELDKLERYLKEHGISYERIDDESRLGIEPPAGLTELDLTYDRHQIVSPCMPEFDWSVICQRGSYGSELGLLEVMHDGVVEGWLPAEDVIKILKL